MTSSSPIPNYHAGHAKDRGRTRSLPCSIARTQMSQRLQTSFQTTSRTSTMACGSRSDVCRLCTDPRSCLQIATRNIKGCRSCLRTAAVEVVYGQQQSKLFTNNSSAIPALPRAMELTAQAALISIAKKVKYHASTCSCANTGGMTQLVRTHYMTFSKVASTPSAPPPAP